MKNNLFKKCSCVLAALLAGVALGGCGGNDGPSGSNNTGKNAHVVTEVGTYPILKDEYKGITLSMMGIKHFAHKPWQENEYFKRMENLTGVKFNFDKIYDWDLYGEKFPLTFLDAKSMPDVFFKAVMPRDSELKLGSQGFFIPLEDLIDQYAPNFKKILEESPIVEKITRAADGHIYALPTIHAQNGDYTTDGIFWINKKWCTNLGINPDEIATIEQFRDVLLRFKNEDANGNGDKNDEKPMYLAGAYSVTQLYAAFGMNLNTWNVYVDNGVIKMGAQEERFKSMLKYLNGMYEEGLINNDYITLKDEAIRAEGFTKDTIGVFYASEADGVVGNDKALDYVALPALTSAYYTGTPFISGRYGVDGGEFAITSNCEYPELAMRWIDTMYDVEYSRWSYIGEEGVEWQWDNEEKTSWSLLMDLQEIKTARTVFSGVGMPGLGPNYDGFNAKSSDPIIRHNAEQLAKMRSKIDPGYPAASFDKDTMRGLSGTTTAISTYLGNLMGDVIRGNVDIDAQWDTVQKTLRSMGVTKYLRALQENYDKFMGK